MVSPQSLLPSPGTKHNPGGILCLPPSVDLLSPRQPVPIPKGQHFHTKEQILPGSPMGLYCLGLEFRHSPSLPSGTQQLSSFITSCQPFKRSLPSQITLLFRLSVFLSLCLPVYLSPFISLSRLFQVPTLRQLFLLANKLLKWEPCVVWSLYCAPWPLPSKVPSTTLNIGSAALIITLVQRFGSISPPLASRLGKVINPAGGTGFQRPAKHQGHILISLLGALQREKAIQVLHTCRGPKSVPCRLVQWWSSIHELPRAQVNGLWVSPS